MKPSELLKVLRIFVFTYPSVLSRVVEDLEVMATDKNRWVKCGTYQEMKEEMAVVDAAVAHYLYAMAETGFAGGEYDRALTLAEEDESFRIRLGVTR